MWKKTLLTMTGWLLCASVGPAPAADWPTWRCDANRSAASPEALPEELHLQWTRELPPQEPAWPNESRLDFDISYEPIVMGRTLFLASANHASVTAFNTASGDEEWRFYAEGPVRFAPIAWQGKVYFGSDDGYLYCVEAESGDLLWKVRGCPGDRDDWRHLGNGRLVSFWPVRGGPVLKEGVIYFAAGIWPTLGVFVWAVDAETGETIWVDRDSNRLENVRIDHNTLHEAGLSPQGYLVIEGDTLLVPNGRSMPARFNRRTGERLYYIQGYRNGHCRVTAMGNHAFVGNNGVVDVRDGREMGSRWVEAGDDAPNVFEAGKLDLFEGPFHPYKLFPACNARSVLASGRAYGTEAGVFYAYDLTRAAKSTYEKDRGGRKLNPGRWDAPLLWKLATDHAEKKPSSVAIIKAGERLYSHAGEVLIAVDPPGDGGEPKVAWEQKLEGAPSSMLAADDRLFVVTKEGRLYCFGADAGELRAHSLQTTPLERADDRWAETTRQIVERAGVTEGYCVLLGLGTGRLLEEVLGQSELRVIAVDPDAAKVNAARDKLVAAGLYGARAEVFVGDPATFRFPAYVAGLVVSENPRKASLLSAMPPERLFSVLRPYGGAACFRLSSDGRQKLDGRFTKADLPNAEVERDGDLIVVRRVGPLPGSAPWTHETADVARSYWSDDHLVKGPLGVLWYGDGADYGFYKYKDYGTGVKPQVVGGRLFALQVFSRTLHAIDVYTGRLLWKTQVEPFTRYASLEDGIYVAGKDRCVVYDPATGEVKSTFEYRTKEGQTPLVSDIRVSDDVILIAVAFEKVRVIEKGLWDSAMLVALDRETGQQLWTEEAKDRFNSHAIAIGDGAVFRIDSVSGVATDKLERRGELPESLPSTIMALDARTGQERWRAETTNPYRTYGIGNWLGMRGNDDWLAYCEELNLLLTGKANQMHAFEAGTGSEVWHKAIGGGQPIIIQGATFVNQGGHTYDTKTGEPLSEAPAFQRGGCNYAVANDWLIFLRDRCVSYVDRATGEKHYLRNIRSGCSNSLVAADGLLSAPCFSVNCVCNYPLQTSFAMVHMPEVEGWDRPSEGETG